MGGATGYLLKPISVKELKSIWQHVFGKKMHDVRDIDGLEAGIKETRIMKTGLAEQSDDGFLFCVVCGSSLEVVKAVNRMGFDKVGPKKILELMNVPWLRREHVASYLQKYRIYLSRVQKHNDLQASYGGLEQPPDATLGEQSGDIVIQDTDPRSHEQCRY
ncbi:hypothetical protein POM88_000357 [Heracleum sosnowskyi]|uniref:Response regulatory domain-containing protein n=1 Tax=Heracleum sosnowskyi TaxID=360622 RepID=A0AAD8JE68_9APIA|nr:hypothetical protein POM88_000357 [Heracleum sosnowskyi]